MAKRNTTRPRKSGALPLTAAIPPDYYCWAECIYTSPEAFELAHKLAGEVCDYTIMKAEVLSDLASGGIYSWLDLDLSWLEWPDIDITSLFDGVDIF